MLGHAFVRLLMDGESLGTRHVAHDGCLQAGLILMLDPRDILQVEAHPVYTVPVCIIVNKHDICGDVLVVKSLLPRLPLLVRISLVQVLKHLILIIDEICHGSVLLEIVLQVRPTWPEYLLPSLTLALLVLIVAEIWINLVRLLLVKLLERSVTGQGFGNVLRDGDFQ